MSADGRQALLDLAGGDMRRVLNILQATAIAFGAVTEDNVYTCIGHPHTSDITAIVNWMLNEEMATALRSQSGGGGGWGQCAGILWGC